MGQKPETSAVPPKLTKIVPSATCHHTSFLGNGGKARRCLLNCPVQPALHAPFHERLSAALSLPAARWGKCPFVYLLRVIGFGFELGASIRRPRANVKRKFAVSSKKLKISRTFPTKTANRTKKCDFTGNFFSRKMGGTALLHFLLDFLWFCPYNQGQKRGERI